MAKYDLTQNQKIALKQQGYVNITRNGKTVRVTPSMVKPLLPKGATQVGTWSRKQGNILVTLKKQFTPYRQDKKIKYLGDLDDPCPPGIAERDIRDDYFPGKDVTLKATSRRGGIVVVEKRK